MTVSCASSATMRAVRASHFFSFQDKFLFFAQKKSLIRDTVSRLFQLIGRRHRLILFVFIPLVSFILHFRIFTWDLQGQHAWRQTETQSMIRNFAEKDFNILNPRVNNRGDKNDIFRMEFPLMQWIYAIFFKLFGDHIIISRILDFLVGLITVFGFYRMCFGLTRHYVASLGAAWAFSFGPTFFFYTMNPLPDVMALCFCIWGMVFFFDWTRDRRWWDALLCMVFFTLSTLVKLPFIVFFSLLGTDELFRLFRTRFRSFRELLLVAVFSLAILSPALAWYIWVIPGWHGNPIVQGMFGLTKDQMPHLYDILQYNLLQVFPKLLLNLWALPFFLTGLLFIFIRRYYRRSLFAPLFILSIGVLTYYLFEAMMIDKWHDYYLFPFLPEIFLIVLYGLYQLLKSQRALLVLIVFCILAYLPVYAYTTTDYRWNIDPGAENPDFLKYKVELRKATPDTSLVIVANDISPYIYLYHLHKKGWAVECYRMSGDTLADRIKHGARYFYCDTRRLDSDSSTQSHFDRLIMQIDSIKVWALKTK